MMAQGARHAARPDAARLLFLKRRGRWLSPGHSVANMAMTAAAMIATPPQPSTRWRVESV